MSSLPETSPVTVPLLVSSKGKDRIAMMTAYDAPTAALLDEAGLDVLLVGDSLAMAVYGEPNRLSATMGTMLRHARAVSRACHRALVVGDMPFLSYQTDPREAVANAGRFLSEAGCAAVKVEGGRRVLPAVEAILAADIPVMGHIGLTPQSVHKLGGFKVQGRARSGRGDPSGRPRSRRRRLLLDRARVRPRGTRGRDHRAGCRPHDRNRRGPSLRRPGSRLPRRRGVDARSASQVRASLRRFVRNDSRRGARVCEGRPRWKFPERPGVLLRFEQAGAKKDLLVSRRHLSSG